MKEYEEKNAQRISRRMREEIKQKENQAMILFFCLMNEKNSWTAWSFF